MLFILKRLSFQKTGEWLDMVSNSWVSPFARIVRRILLLGDFWWLFLFRGAGVADLILCLCCEFLSFLPLESFKT